MGSLRAEFGKLRRSLSWAVVVLLPLTAIVSGTATTLASGAALAQGWHTLWLRVVVFHGLFPLAAGIAVLASLVWRVEHRGSNWNALMGRSTSSLGVVAGKAAVLAALVAAMQVVLVAGTVLAGKTAFGLPGFLPARYLLVSVLVVLACLPVAALQSALSMLMRSFAAPVAVALLGAAASVGLLMTAGGGAVVVPYALLTRTTQLGTGTFADTGPVTAGVVAVLVVASVVLTAAVVAVSAAVLDRRDIG
ncbi:hypothetical protein EV383_2734 [Pseudonocardia sediminis]|uniref:ABC-2 type transport system permease protein n=1 Tax=Pseudonocardia sediminis TaxID=1397368 RepID=A0A4Q7UV52_PSEST|nr:ABC transporter permease [Pseudonocardia sediminis]RZT85847.1 hypothetical protein EV383_2734 [Pseudonocardia sediminis]